MEIEEAKSAIDAVIRKARVHLYKPIQIAEILYQHRVHGKIELNDVEQYRIESRRWRDEVCSDLLGRTSTSSARYQDDLFNGNAIPPAVLTVLGVENRQKDGVVEAYIYRRFVERYSMMTSALHYCSKCNRNTFRLSAMLGNFRKEPGLRRSIDKMFEIVVYALFSVLVEELGVTIEIKLDERHTIMLKEFEDFVKALLNLNINETQLSLPAKIHRVGVTNAADRGLDMYGNFGLAIQVKHLSLNEELAEEIVESVSADRIVIVCRDIEKKVIVSILNQIGWKARIQSIIAESDLEGWYEKALRGQFGEKLGDKLLCRFSEAMQKEFPSAKSEDFRKFFEKRGYHKVSDKTWNLPEG